VSANQDEATTILGNTEMGCVDQAAFDVIPKVGQSLHYFVPIRSESRSSEWSDVLEHERARHAFAHDSNRFREKIALIVASELAASDGERLAWNSPSNEGGFLINKDTRVKCPYIAVPDRPTRPISQQRFTSHGIPLDQRKARESRGMKADRLASTSGT
jgi:hypothetical protein